MADHVMAAASTSPVREWSDMRHRMISAVMLAAACGLPIVTQPPRRREVGEKTIPLHEMELIAKAKSKRERKANNNRRLSPRDT